MGEGVQVLALRLALLRREEGVPPDEEGDVESRGEDEDGKAAEQVLHRQVAVLDDVATLRTLQIPRRKRRLSNKCDFFQR